MKRPLVILIASILPLVLAPAAQAKGPVKKLEVCGDRGCAAVPVTPGRGVGGREGVLMLLGTPVSQVPEPRPYVDLNVTIGDGEGAISMFYVPGAQVVFHEGWSQVPPGLGAKLDAAAAWLGTKRPTIRTVVVGERISRDPGAYAPLLLGRLQPTRQPVDATATSIGIRFTTTEATPWTSRGDGYATYVPSAHVIRVGLDWFKPSAALDERIRSDAATVRGTPSTISGGLSPWWLVLPAAGLIVGVLTVILRRRRGHPRTVTVA